jgi:hypothetical protein
MALVLSFSLPIAGLTLIEENSVYCVDQIHSGRVRLHKLDESSALWLLLVSVLHNREAQTLRV